MNRAQKVKSIGKAIEVDDLIFEIETDKTALELTAEVSGQITEFVVSEGDVISSDQLLTKLSVGEVKIMEEIAISRESVGGTDMGSRINKADVIGHMRKAGQATVKQYELPRSVASEEWRERRE